jgi:DNA-binding HxlR family transcriptional regulator
MNHGNLHGRSVAHCRLPDFRKALGMFTGRWKLEILWLLYQRNYRVGELRRAMPNITQPVLTAKLQELEADGLVKRKIHQELRPDVEYEMTAGARQFGFFVQAVMSWARQKTLSQDSKCRQIAPRGGAVVPRA